MIAATDLDADERIAIEQEGCGLRVDVVDTELPPIGDRGELEMSTTLVRRFLGMPDDEATELTFFTERGIHIAHATTVADHVWLLRDGEQLHGFRGAYQLVNPMTPDVLARYTPNRIHRASNRRVSDAEITGRRAIFVDVDAVRVSGISSTDAQLREAHDVSASLELWLRQYVPREAIGRGCSGNGYFLLVALEPTPADADTTARVRKLLGLLGAKFSTDSVKVDGSVFNAARLMPAPGTMKRKGADTPERPHRMTTFSCCGSVKRVPLGCLS